MPIEARCSGCGREYRLKDGFAGKKFRCKNCRQVVIVPAATTRHQDPWDDLELTAPAGDPISAAPARPRAASSRKRTGKRRRRGGIPVSVILAILCESLLILLNMLLIVQNLLIAQHLGLMCGSLFRVMIEVVAIIGYVLAQSAIQWMSVVLSALAIVGIVCCVTLFPMDRVAADGGTSRLMAVIVGQIVLFSAIIICLLVPSSKDWFSGA